MTARPDLLVGRAAEQARLRSVVAEALRGHASTVVLVGEAGIGKSALVAGLREHAVAGGARLALGQAFPVSIEQPLRPLLSVLEQLGGAVSARGRTLIEATVGDPLSLLLQQALDQLDSLAADGPVVVVLEDLQWADRATLTVVHHLATREVDLPVALVATARPPLPGSPLHHLLSGLGPQVAELLALAEGEGEELVERRLCRPPGPELRRLVGTCGGNPMLVEALVDALVAGRLVRDHGRYVDVDADVRPVPGGVVRAQVDAVPPACLQLLQLAAVTPGALRVDLLSRLAGRRPTDLLADLDDAVLAGVLRHVGQDLHFRHDLHRAAVLATLPASAAAAVHLDVARELEHLGAPRLEVAEHLAQGARRGNREAVAGLTAAAEELVGHDPATALRVSELALALVADPQVPAQLQLVRVGALAACGQSAEASLLGRALLRDSPPAPVEARLRRELALAAFLDGRAEEAGDHMARVVAIAPDAVTAARARTELAWAQFLGLDASAAAEGAALGVAQGEATTRISALTLQCWLGLWGLDAPSAHLAAQALEGLVSTTPVGEWQVFQPLLSTAAVHLERGDLDVCRASLDRGRLGAAEAGTSWAVAAYDAMEAGVDLRLGRLDAAAEAARRAVEGTALVDGFGVEVWSRAVLAQVHLWRGEVAAAEREVEAAHQAAADGRAQLGLDHLVVAEAGLALRQGDPALAVQVLREGWSFFDAVGIRYVRGPIGVALLRAAARLGDRSADGEVADALAEAAARSGLPGLAVDAARAEAFRARTPAAVTAAVEAARRQGHPLVELEALRDAAALLAADRPAARSFAQAAAVLAARHDVVAEDAGGGRVRSHSRPTFGIESLTDAERRVAALVVEGRTNAQIAAHLIVSRRTVDTQVLAAYRKLGIRSRVELTRVLLGADPGLV